MPHRTASPAGGVHPLVLRATVAEAAVRQFSGKPIVYGQSDCLRLSAWVLKRLGRKVSLAGIGRYTTELGALRALKRKGYDRLDQAIDAYGLLRIPPAMILPCDLVGGQPDGDDARWVALGVSLGGGRVLAFHGGVCRVIQPTGPLLTAWRSI